jgi:hypothetical protein
VYRSDLHSSLGKLACSVVWWTVLTFAGVGSSEQATDTKALVCLLCVLLLGGNEML